MLRACHLRLWLPAILILAGLAGLASVAHAASTVRISEILAESDGGLADEDGETPDWIELFNPDSAAVNLDGWYLTDNASELTRWKFPAVTIPPAGYLVVFASAKDRAPTNGSPLHTSFSLDSSGEFLALVGPDGHTVVSGFTPAFPPQLPNISWSADGYHSPPTPGATNGPGYAGQVENLDFSVARGFFDQPVTVTLSTPTLGATIVYTTDGSLPSADHGIRVDPLSPTAPPVASLTVSATTALRATAWKAGFISAKVGTQTYLFPGKVVEQAGTWGGYNYRLNTNSVGPAELVASLRSLPTVSMAIPTNSLFDPDSGIYLHPLNTGDQWERAGSVELIYPDGRPGVQANTGVRMHGRESRDYVKKSFRLYFRSQYGDAHLNHPVFQDHPHGHLASRRFEQLILHSASQDGWFQTRIDPSTALYLRNRWTQDMCLSLGNSGGHTQPVHLYINGVYWGMYNIRERIDSPFFASYAGGQREDYDVFNESGYLEGNDAAWTKTLDASQKDLTVRANYEALQRFIDIDQYIRYAMVNHYTLFVGWRSQNNYVFGRRRAENQPWQFIPWDADGAYGQYFGEDVNADYTSEPGPGGLFAVLRRNAEFRLRFADLAQRHLFRDGIFSSRQMDALIRQTAAQIEPALPAESTRWGNGYTRDKSWRPTLDALLTRFFPGRAAALLRQYRAGGLYPSIDAPVFNPHGGSAPAEFSLVMLNPNPSAGTIYYTTDGRDPREAWTSAIVGAAYTAPVTLIRSSVVKARILAGSEWSALAEASFVVGAPPDSHNLALTEILHHPAPTNAVSGGGVTFLELKNVGTTPVLLDGLSLSGDVAFDFPAGRTLAPGEFFVLTRDAVQFAAAYPGRRANGVYVGELDPTEGTVRLTHPLRGTVVEVNYASTAPWPLLADGKGFSLVPVQPQQASAWQPAGNWRASAAPGGSPGSDDPPSSIPPVRVNEILSSPPARLTDAIELFNPTDGPADVSGWYLTDDAQVPRKFRLPPTAVIPAHGFLVLDETHFNPVPATSANFSLSAQGEEVFLFSAGPDGSLTGYSHGFRFGAAARGISFGRHVISTGEERFPAQVASTSGATNAGPRIGPVVIQEIHFQPAPGEDEFVELANVSDAPVALFDASNPASTWRIDGLGFVFPTNVTIASGEIFVIAAVDPALFRSRHHVPAAVQVFGPCTGNLSDHGERLQLQRPNVTSGSVSYVTVDDVSYAPDTPWPAGAAGTGASLQRAGSLDYGDDPIHWRVARASPGSRPESLEPPVISVQPEDALVARGQNVVLSVGASGTGPLGFQWRFNGSPVAGANTASLALTNLQVSQSGLYEVIVFDAGGSTRSRAASLSVVLPAAFITQPESRFVRPGATVSFRAAAEGGTAFNYQWQFNGADLPGANLPVWSLSNVQTNMEGSYTVVVRDRVGSITSAPARLVLLFDPTFLIQPQSQTVVERETVTFTVAVTGTRPLGYRWRRNGATIGFSDDAHPTFTITNVQLTTAGSYTVVVTNAATTVGRLSATAVLTVLADRDGDHVPDAWETAQQLKPDDSSDASADPDGDGQTNLQEYLAGTDPHDSSALLRLDLLSVQGDAATMSFRAASNRTYNLEFKESPTAGRWTWLTNVSAGSTDRVVRVTDPYPMLDQRLYRLVAPQGAQPAPGPVILRSPRSQEISAGADARFSVVAVGKDSLSYQWRSNGTNLPGQTAAELVLSSVQTNVIGSYSVEISDGYGRTLSQPAFLNVLVLPVLAVQPRSQAVEEGQGVRLEVQAVGFEPLTYRWFRNDLPLPQGRGPVLTLEHVTSADAGRYRVAVRHTTPFGPAGVLSESAVLTILPVR